MPSETFASDKFATAPPVDRVIAELAARQHGLLRTAQLRAIGLDAAGITRRVLAGRLHRRYRAVYSLAPGPLSREAQFLAAVLAAGDGAVLSHLAAAELWALRRHRAARIDVLVPRKRRAPPGTCFHEARSLDSRDVTAHRGVPVATVARTLVELSDVLTVEELANVIHEAAFRGRFSLLATQDAIARANGRHSLAVLHDAIALHEAGSAGAKSRNEVALLALLAAHGFPRPRVNVHVAGHEVDLHWPERRLAVEVDGSGHARARTRREDAVRDAALRAAGYTVVRVSEDELEREPERVLGLLTAGQGLEPQLPEPESGVLPITPPGNGSALQYRSRPAK